MSLQFVYLLVVSVFSWLRVGARNSATLCDLGVFVKKATESVSSCDLDVGVNGVGECSEGAGVVQGAVWAVAVEMGFIFGEDFAQMVGVHDEDPVEEFTAYAADPAFHDRVHLWSLRRGGYDPDSLGVEDLIEYRGELRVAVTNQEFEVPTWSGSSRSGIDAGLVQDPLSR
jgi:hypothetical protein